MFDFLKSTPIHNELDEETGTYADGVLQVPEIEVKRVVAREHGHDAHMRDYGERREIARGSLGFA